MDNSTYLGMCVREQNNEVEKNRSLFYADGLATATAAAAAAISLHPFGLLVGLGEKKMTEGENTSIPSI